MGNPEGDQAGDGQTYPRLAVNKKRPTREHHTTKPRQDISTGKKRQTKLPRPYGTGRDSGTTKVQHLKGRIPQEDTRTTVPQMRTTLIFSQELPEEGRTQTIQRTSQELATHEENRLLANQTEDEGNRGRTRTRTVAKRRMSPVRDGLRYGPERKPIIMENY